MARCHPVFNPPGVIEGLLNSFFSFKTTRGVAANKGPRGGGCGGFSDPPPSLGGGRGVIKAPGRPWCIGRGKKKKSMGLGLGVGRLPVFPRGNSPPHPREARPVYKKCVSYKWGVSFLGKNCFCPLFFEGVYSLEGVFPTVWVRKKNVLAWQAGEVAGGGAPSSSRASIGGFGVGVWGIFSPPV